MSHRPGDVLEWIEDIVTDFHKRLFDDDEWGCEEYVELYAPSVLFLIYCAVIMFIAYQ